MKDFVTKIKKISQNITPFAGISYVNSEFNNCGMAQLIDNELGQRVQTVGYSYSEIISNWFDLFLCGGECAEDINEAHMNASLKQIPGNAVGSPDTLIRGVKELAVDNTGVVSSTGNSYQFNINDKMNNLNIKAR